MPTSFVTTTFVSIVTLNSFGALAPVDKSLLPPPLTGPLMWSLELCRFTIGRMEHPEKYTCQVFRSELTTPWEPPRAEGVKTLTPTEVAPDESKTPPPGTGGRSEVTPQSLAGSRSKLPLEASAASPLGSEALTVVGPTALKDEDKPYLEPAVAQAPAP